MLSTVSCGQQKSIEHMTDRISSPNRVEGVLGGLAWEDIVDS